ncbi:hypothetical protein [Halalkalibacillus sediminis]|uniref:hypothetical protein n=1 Tax=Halalkalibacillus sediminis TaxID=2018042 RepID=UPI00192E4EC3|nr:hypothetical protein [Halalkalibacillus sediminis]
MGYPNVPDINSEITLTRQDAINIMLASIGLEELSLAHLVNGEAEKLQRALGTLQIPGTEGDDPEDYFPELVGNSIDNLIAVNRNINQTLKIAAHKEFLLLLKLEDLLNFELDEDGNGNGPDPITECICSITGQNVGGPVQATVTINGGDPEVEVNTTYNVEICGEDCDPSVNELSFNFVGLTPVVNFNQGRATNVECDPAAGTATVTGTIRRANVVYFFTLEITDGGDVMDLTILPLSPEAEFESFVVNFTAGEGDDPFVEIEDCANNTNGEV